MSSGMLSVSPRIVDRLNETLKSEESVYVALMIGCAHQKHLTAIDIIDNDLKIDDESLYSRVKDLRECLVGGDSILGLALSAKGAELKSHQTRALSLMKKMLSHLRRTDPSNFQCLFLLSFDRNNKATTAMTLKGSNAADTFSSATFKAMKKEPIVEYVKIPIRIDTHLHVSRKKQDVDVFEQIREASLNFLARFRNDLCLFSKSTHELIQLSSSSGRSIDWRDVIFTLPTPQREEHAAPGEKLREFNVFGVIELCAAFISSTASDQSILDALKIDFERSFLVRCRFLADETEASEVNTTEPVITYELPMRLYATSGDRLMQLTDFAHSDETMEEIIERFTGLTGWSLTSESISKSNAEKPQDEEDEAGDDEDVLLSPFERHLKRVAGERSIAEDEKPGNPFSMWSAAIVVGTIAFVVQLSAILFLRFHYGDE